MTIKFRQRVDNLKKEKRIIILGHRGCRKSDMPENTIAAFERAFEVGAEGIEIDVESTLDGKTVVINRWFCNQSFGFFPWEKDFKFLKEIANEKGIYVPTFEETCEFIKGKDDPIFNVEIKSSNGGICKTAQEAVKIISDFGIENSVIISSFDLNTLLTVKFLKPSLETAYLFRKEDRVLNIEDKKTLKYKLDGIINRTGIKAFLAGANTLHPEIKLFKTKGKFIWQMNPFLYKKHVNTWTVDSEDDFNKALKNNVDIIISDNPEVAVGYRKRFFEGL